MDQDTSDRETGHEDHVSCEPPRVHHPIAPDHRVLPLPARLVLMAVALLCVALGLIGVVVPGMPTTVFILMAAWAAARSSPRLSRWLYAHRLFGPVLLNWEQGGFVARRVKWIASGTMALSGVIVCLTVASPWGRGGALLSMALVSAWLWCRPEPPA